MNPFESNLDKNGANYQALTPLSFLPRTAAVHPDRVALLHGDQRITWAEAYSRCRQLASALEKAGIGEGDTVATMLPNTPPQWEAHQAVPATGAVLNALNYRLDAAAIAFILEHGEAKLLITDKAFSSTIKPALEELGRRITLIEVDDPVGAGEGGELPGRTGLRGFPCRRRPRAPLAAARPTNGRRSRSTTPPAPPAIPKAWSITIAAPT